MATDPNVLNAAELAELVTKWRAIGSYIGRWLGDDDFSAFVAAYASKARRQLDAKAAK
jgi:hypothetical protein